MERRVQGRRRQESRQEKEVELNETICTYVNVY
jgi:hypothetical protein